MNVRRNIAAVLFGLSFAATPAFASEPTPAPKPAETQPLKTSKEAKINKLSKDAKPMKVTRLHHAAVKTAPAPVTTPAPSK